MGEMCAINMAQFQIYGSLAAFFLPLVIMFIMYTLTIRTLKKQAQLVSNIMVHNSPPYSVPRAQYTSCRSSMPRTTPRETDSPKSALKNYKVQQRNGIFANDIQLHETEPLRPRCAVCNKRKEALVQESSWRKAVRMVTNIFRRVKGKTTSSSSSTNAFNNNERYVFKKGFNLGFMNP